MGTRVHCWWEYKMVQLLGKIVWWFLKKLKTELPYDPAIPPLDLYPGELKSGSRRDICALTFIAALSTIAKIWKQPKGPLKDEWIKKKCYVHTMECSSSLKN